MKIRKLLALVLSLVMVLCTCSSAFAANLTGEVTELEAKNSDISMYIATQSYVLLENNGVLPLKQEGADKVVALFGSAAENTIKGGTGAGDVNERSHDNIDEAFVAADWTIANPTWLARMEKQGGNGYYQGQDTKPDIAITDAELAEATAATDLAVYSISRTAGEGRDRYAVEGDYLLTAIERANIELLAANFEDLVIVLNTCVIDTAWIAEIDNIDAVVFMSNGGQRGCEALVKVLEGEYTPSGKLTDTWPAKYSDYPYYDKYSANDRLIYTEYYYEGIYNGYRYFDTFGLDVCYEFGYGMSYTEFDIDVANVAVDEEAVTVDVDVTNIGNTYSGKEIVQVYFSAPDGDLEKPYQELAAYGKTDELAPGEKQTLTLTYATTDMSSYSEELAAYIMEAGDYIIRVGNSSRNTVAAAVVSLDETVITEQLSNQYELEDTAVLDEVSNEGATPIANNDAAELADAPVFELDPDAVPYENNASPYDDETITTYLFAEDAANYDARENITLNTRLIWGVLNNPGTPGLVADVTTQYVQGVGGYSSTTYSEVVEIVDALPEGITKETAKLTDVFEGKITMEQFIACLSYEELARINVGGAGSMEVPDGAHIGASASSVRGGAGQTTQAYYLTRHIPSMPNADGPAGLRITQHYTQDGVDYYQYCTAFPVGMCYASSWDTDIHYMLGEAVGEEMKEFNVTSWLAPGMNIHRNPLCGRNFEYYSEDPLVTGITAAYATMGVQSHEGIGVTLKHYWGNSQEFNRTGVNNVISERAAREIYLKGFEIAIKLSRPMSIMTAYNANNGWPAADCFDSCTDLARGEWGFTGYIMTDWGGGQSTPLISMHAGNDMIMPGGDSVLRGVLNAYGTIDPEFAADGSIANAGSFVAAADGKTEYIAYVDSYEVLSESVLKAIADGKAKFCDTADADYVTWYGEHINRICLGDLQKASINVLNVALQSQDMVKLYADLLNEEIEVGSYSENNDALISQGWTMATKGEISNVGIVADTVVADNAAADTAAVEISYVGDEAITSARIDINSELEVVEIVSDYAIENNDGYVVIYAADGGEIEGVLCTVTYAIADADGAWLANGEYAVDLEVVDATNAAEEQIVLKGVDGEVIIANAYVAGDANLDGVVTNADLIAIARYLVDLVEFNAYQLEAADVDDNGLVNNVDLVKVARVLVAA